MASKRRERLKIQNRDGIAVVNIGHVEIWDGADLALLRETLSKLVETDRLRSIGVDMSSVKYIPSGFFGMLFEYYERGVHVSLYGPQPNVENMLWFRLFFNHNSEDRFDLHDDPQRQPTPPPSSDWADVPEERPEPQETETVEQESTGEGVVELPTQTIVASDQLEHAHEVN